MNGSQKAVLWMGLILVVLNLDWAALKNILFKGGTGGGSSGGGGSPSVTVPIDPLLPGPISPKITIPLSQTPPGNKAGNPAPVTLL